MSSITDERALNIDNIDPAFTPQSNESDSKVCDGKFDRNVK